MASCARCEDVLGDGDGLITPNGLVCARCELALKIEQGPTLTELAAKDDTKLSLALLAGGAVLLAGGAYLLSMSLSGTAGLADLGLSSRVVGKGLGYALTALAFGVAAVIGGAKTIWRRGKLR